MNKKKRLETILELVKNHTVTSHQLLGQLLEEKGVAVTQTTLSRDIRELRLIKVPGTQNAGQYRVPDDWDSKPNLTNILPSLFVSVESACNLLVVKTVNGGAAALAYAIDWEGWPEVMGTVAGEDTVFVAVSDEKKTETVRDRLLGMVSVSRS
jgi:transcriptional regulator of arginine metabolism